MENIPIALTIAGSDPSSGAGVQIDLRTFWEHGVHGLSVITAITSQNSQKVFDVYGLPDDVVASQLKAILDDFKIDAVKIGMLFSKKIALAVSNILKEYNIKKIVLDPVIISSSGYRLLQDEGLNLLINNLIPITYIITPNIFEASILSGIKIKNEDEILEAAEKIQKLGVKYVLIKGGHLANKNKGTDFLFHGRSVLKFSGQMLHKAEVHGTGCILSSAIAANLAKGLPIIDSIKNSKSFMENVFESSFKLGKGRRIWTKQ